MEPKNVMLLGFINRAVEYLDSHMDEEPDSRLAELKNIDLASLRDELADNLDISLGTMQSTMATLLKAGNEAFDEFVVDSRGKKTVSDEFEKLFDVDIDGARKNKRQQLAKLLSFYNLDNDVEIDDEKKNAVSIDDAYLQEIIRNANNADISHMRESIPAKEKADTRELDDIFDEIVSNERGNSERVEPIKTAEPITTKKVVKENNTSREANGDDKKYVSYLISDLKNQIEKDRQNSAKEKDIKNKDVTDRITKLYPYLSSTFIRTVYDLKDSLAKTYPFDKKIIVLHRIAFGDVDNLRKFCEIGLNHDYQINADENKMIVDIFKEIKNGDGKILANIYEIANQGSLLGGSYEGYNVILNEEE